MLATAKTTNYVTDFSATAVIEMRWATRNILYTTVNSWRYENGEPRARIDTWKIILFVVDGICALLLAAWAVMALLKFRTRWTAETSARYRYRYWALKSAIQAQALNYVNFLLLVVKLGLADKLSSGFLYYAWLLCVYSHDTCVYTHFGVQLLISLFQWWNELKDLNGERVKWKMQNNKH